MAPPCSHFMTCGTLFSDLRLVRGIDDKGLI